MPLTTKAKIGFIGSSAPSSPHHESFKAFIPKEIDFTFVQEENGGGSLYDARGKVDSLIGQTVALVEQHGWDGVIISGGPREVLNPGLWGRLSSALRVPVATALSSSVAALKVFSVRRVLLMTPVDDKLKGMYRDFLAEFGIEAIYPAQTLRAHTDAQKLTPGDVESMTKTTFMTQPGADAIYFQGALLDPIKVLDKMEVELNVPIVASNPAMLWFVLSKLGLSYRRAGYGKLLASWPALPPMVSQHIIKEARVEKS
jgi:maleate cis-trans isomerase